MSKVTNLPQELIDDIARTLQVQVDQVRELSWIIPLKGALLCLNKIKGIIHESDTVTIVHILVLIYCYFRMRLSLFLIIFRLLIIFIVFRFNKRGICLKMDAPFLLSFATAWKRREASKTAKFPTSSTGFLRSLSVSHTSRITDHIEWESKKAQTLILLKTKYSGYATEADILLSFRWLTGPYITTVQKASKPEQISDLLFALDKKIQADKDMVERGVRPLINALLDREITTSTLNLVLHVEMWMKLPSAISSTFQHEEHDSTFHKTSCTSQRW